MTFDEFKDFIKSIPVPAQRMGIFNLDIKYNGDNYNFHSLKENASGNADLTGFGLNHHFGNVRELPTKESIFHDSEDISIDIWREEIVNIEKKAEREINIVTTKWEGTLTWN